MQNHSPNRPSGRPCHRLQRRLQNWLGIAGIIGFLPLGCYEKDAPDRSAATEQPEPNTTESRDLPGDGLTTTPDTTTRETPPRYTDGVPRAVGDIQDDLGLTEPHADAGTDAGAPGLDGGI